MTDEGGVITRQEGPNQVIHIRTDSNGILEDLFKGIQNPNAKAAVPLRERKLPPSFFIQPSTEYSGSTTNERKPVPAGCVHVRSRSSPASIQQTLSLPPQSANSPTLQQQHASTQSVPQNNHLRQKSVPATQSQSYNINVNIGPYRATNLPDGRIVFQNRFSHEFYQDSPRVRDQIVGPLPERWAQQRDERGEVYYVDHSNRTTTWFDPRLPEEIQKLSIATRQQHGSGVQQQQTSVGNAALFDSQGISRRTADVQQNECLHTVIPTSAQNHQNFLPTFGSSVQLQQNTSNQPMASHQTLQHAHSSQPVLLPQDIHRLKQLEMEREMMRNRQKEIQKQEEANRRVLGDYDMMGSPMSPLTNLRLADPFLGAQFHGRQESGDSGFSVSTPHTPENFLAQTMDEMSLYNEAWEAEASMNIPAGSADNTGNLQSVAQQDMVVDGDEELSDIIFRDLEAVLTRNEKSDPFVTWL